MADGIKDKVAIIGVGCTKFGERWDTSAGDLLVDAFKEAIADAGIQPKDIDMAFGGTAMPETHLGPAGTALAENLRLDYVPFSRNENYCCTGADTIRYASYAVASGACDVALAIGVEKLKDVGTPGLPVGGVTTPPRGTLQGVILSGGPGSFAVLATAYFAKYNLDFNTGKEMLARISAKSHYNGSLNPRAHLRKAVTVQEIIAAPFIAWPLGLFDCCGVSDGGAAAIVVRASEAKKFRKNPIYIKSLQICSTSGEPEEWSAGPWDATYIEMNRQAARRAYKEAGVTNPREEISFAEVHDCFSITEAVIMEDLGFSAVGHVKDDVFSGRFAHDGAQPMNISGGLKSFGHPIGATGLRMIYELVTQFQGRAELPARQLKNARLGLTHNLGDAPTRSVIAVTIMGPELG
jgi:acetyl-CoA C-acetyltransferase